MIVPGRAKLPTNQTSNKYPVHRWMNFIAGFSPEFVSQCIRGSNVDSNSVLIDPFAGLSTSLVQASFEGLRSVGFEVHPFFADMSRAKLGRYTSDNLNELHSIKKSLRSFEGEFNGIWSRDAVAFLVKLLPEDSLRMLASALLAELQVSYNLRPLYRLIFSRVLELTSFSLTDGIYKAPSSRKKTNSFEIAFAKVWLEICDDISLIASDSRVNGTERQSLALLYEVSAESLTPLKDSSCSLCITSPPYLNNFDFCEMTRMQFYFWRYAESWNDISERIRRKQIINTTTVPADLKHGQSGYIGSLSPKFQAKLEPLVFALKEQRTLRPGKKDYYALVYPYFSQMQSVIRELARVLKPNSLLHLVVADSALYGVHIETEQLLADLLNENGFKVKFIDKLRLRGERWRQDRRDGAGKPLGEFHVLAQSK